MAKFWWWLVDWTRYLLGRETRDEAWISGHNEGEAEWLEMMEDKDNFITMQAEQIRVLDDWIYSLRVDVPEHIKNILIDYR